MISRLFLLYNFFIKINCRIALLFLNFYYRKIHLFTIQCKKEKKIYIDNLSSYLSIKKRYEKKISIIITAYNEEKLIYYAVSSILSQTYENIEIIFIDDCSTDETVLQFEKACKDARFKNYKLIKMTKNTGPFVTKNIGIESAIGEYITFHDADDWAHPQRLEEQIKQFYKPEIVASISQLVRIKENGELFARNIYPINRIAMVSLMFKREVFEALGYFYTDVLGADSEYFERIKLYYGEERVDNIKKVLTFAAHRPNSRTTSPLIGVPEFGENPKRLADWRHCKERLKNMEQKENDFFVSFSFNTEMVQT